jgi:probable HAF family extracellular repeat protein
MKNSAFFSLLVAGLLAGALASPAWGHRYRIVDLGPNEVDDINDVGAVAGTEAFRATVYRKGRWHELPGDPNDTTALGINDSGQVAGAEWINGSQPLPVLWQANRRKVMLPLPKGGWRGVAWAISNTGFIAGHYDVQVPEQSRCIVWTPSGHGKDLGMLGEGRGCISWDVNDSGQVVGQSDSKPYARNHHAFFWQSGQMHDLGTLGGKTSAAYGVNALGEVVGYAETAHVSHAFIWRNGRMTDLDDADSFRTSEALAINASGEIVGRGYSSQTRRTEAVRFTQPGIVPLAEEVDDIGDWQWLESALSVNESGEIIGRGLLGADRHSFKLVPIH